MTIKALKVILKATLDAEKHLTLFELYRGRQMAFKLILDLLSDD